MTENTFVERLIKDFGYTDYSARAVYKKINEKSLPSTRDAIKIWWETGQMPEFEVENYTIQKLIKERGLNPISALLTIDWLLREPNEAKEALKRKPDTINNN